MTDRVVRDRTGEQLEEEELYRDPTRRAIERCRETLAKATPPKLTGAVDRKSRRAVGVPAQGETPQ